MSLEIFVNTKAYALLKSIIRNPRNITCGVKEANMSFCAGSKLVAKFANIRLVTKERGWGARSASLGITKRGEKLVYLLEQVEALLK